MKTNIQESLIEMTKAIIKQDFTVHVIFTDDGTEDMLELEGTTPKGIEMGLYLDFREHSPNRNIYSVADIYKELKRQVDSYDTDEEVDLHRANALFREKFSCRESVEEFESWQKTLEQLLERAGAVAEKYQGAFNEKDFGNIDFKIADLM